MAEAEVARLREERDRLRTALEGIRNWCDAYPVQAFPPEAAGAALKACEAAGILVDAMHGTWAQHLLAGIGQKARAALEPNQ